MYTKLQSISKRDIWNIIPLVSLGLGRIDIFYINISLYNTVV